MRVTTELDSRLPTATTIALFILVTRFVLVLLAVNLYGDDGARYMQEAVNLARYGTSLILWPCPRALPPTICLPFPRLPPW